MLLTDDLKSKSQKNAYLTIMCYQNVEVGLLICNNKIKNNGTGA